MPGIAGFIGQGVTGENGRLVQKMVSSLMHEPSYRSGTLELEEAGLWTGWACHVGSFADGQPFWNQARDICVLVSGEHFAERSAEMNGAYLARAYEEYGMRFFERLNGAISGVVVDLREGKAVLFNDRYGLNRIYYHQNADGFYFASEAKSLLKVLPQLRRVDMQSLGEFFSCGCALENRSLFSGISLLPAGSAWTFKHRQGAKKENYFKPDLWANQPQLPAAEYYEKLKETFARVLPRYLQGKQRVALSLTGGLDSRMIIACAHAPPGQLPCYTFGGMYRECADVRLSQEIAKVCRQEHQVIRIGPNFFSEFPALAERSVYYTDGAMDVTGAVELFANRRAREIAPVRLTGNYGSEVLRGNVAFKVGSLWPEMFDEKFVPFLESAAATYAREKRVPRTAFIVSRQVPWHHYARMAVEQSQLTVRSPYLDNDLVAVAYQAPEGLAVNKDLAHRFIEDCEPALAKIPTDRGVAGRPGARASKLKVFRQEFLPRAEYVYDYGMPQWLAQIDRWLAPLHVERLFLGRQKFYHFRVWYRDELSKYVKEVLLDARALGRPYLNRGRVEEMVTAHVKGRGNYTSEIHKLLTSELMQRQLIEQN